MVPKILTAEQKALRVQLCEEWMNADLEEGILNRVVTGDESWVYEYDPGNKRQSMEWRTPDEPQPKKARMSKSKGKSMLITFFDCQVVILKEWVPPGTNVNAVYYCKILRKLCKHIRKKNPKLWKNGWLLHHDNTSSHSAVIIREYFAKNRITLLEHPCTQLIWHLVTFFISLR